MKGFHFRWQDEVFFVKAYESFEGQSNIGYARCFRGAVCGNLMVAPSWKVRSAVKKAVLLDYAKGDGGFHLGNFGSQDAALAVVERVLDGHAVKHGGAQ